MATKEEHRAEICMRRNSEFMERMADEASAALAERDEAREKIAELEQAAAWAKQHQCKPPLGNPTREEAMDRIIELERELKNAREAHSCLDLIDDVCDLDLSPKPTIQIPPTGMIETPNGPITAHAGDVLSITTDKDGKVTMIESKPPASADGEGPFGVKTEESSSYVWLTEDGSLQAYLDPCTAERYANLLNLGVKSEGMQKRIEELEAERNKWKTDAELRAVNEEYHRDRADAAEANLNALGASFEATRKALGISAFSAPEMMAHHASEVVAQMNAAEAREKAQNLVVEQWESFLRKCPSGSHALFVVRSIRDGAGPNQPADQAPEATKP